MYQARVAALAALGFGYIILMLLAVLAALVGVVYLAATSHAAMLVKLAIPLLALLAAILRSFWVRIEAPKRLPVARSDSPELWRLVDDIRRPLAAPRVHEIQIDGAFNAGVTQVPRLGILGWQRNYLTFGLPLLQGLTLDQLRAVVGHELGHLSANHSRFAGWVYRLRQTWNRLLTALEAQKSPLGKALFTRFFHWYAPYFNAYSFVLARADEYEADRCAAQVAGGAAARSALTRIAVAGRFLDQLHWPEVTRRIVELPDPPTDAVGEIGASLQAPLPEPVRSGLLEAAWATETDYDNTHPSLPDRLAGLGWRAPPDPEWTAAPAPRADAASLLLGEARTAELARRLSEEWAASNRDAWRREHQQLAEIKEEIRSLEAAAAAAPLEPDRGWRLIMLINRIDSERALVLARRFAEEHPDHATAQYQVGLALLGQNDSAGLAHLDRAAELDHDYILPGAQAAAAFLAAAGRTEEAAEYQRRAEQRGRLLEAAQSERKEMDREMVLEPSGLPEAELSELRGALARHRDAKEVYLVRRRTVLLPDIPCYLAGVRPRRSWTGRPVIDEPALIRALLQDVPWREGTYLVPLVGKNKWLRGRLKAMGALVIEQ
jgi:Zn-dependent protease with chaperone function